MKKYILYLLVALSTTIYANNWPTTGGNLPNHRQAINSPDIDSQTVKNLNVKWIHQTAPDKTENNPRGDSPFASITANPAVVGDRVFFNDWTGHITAIDKNTGKVLWKKNYINDISAPGYHINYSRNTPAATKNGLLLVGGSYFIVAPLCRVNEIRGKPSKPDPKLAVFSCVPGDGGIVVALDQKTGDVVWRTKVDDHPAAKITGSISVDGNTAYVPIAGWEEDWAKSYPNVYDMTDYPKRINLLPKDKIDLNSKYPCCSFRGGLAAIDVKTGKKLWHHHNSIGMDTEQKLSEPIRKALGKKGYFGVSTYGHSPTIDNKRDAIYIATANNYNSPDIVAVCEVARRATGKANPTQADLDELPEPHNGRKLPGDLKTCNELNPAMQTFTNAIIAIDKTTGKTKWAFQARQYDAWIHSCDSPDFGLGSIIGPTIFPEPEINLENCPKVTGPDYGFGHQPVLIDALGLVIAGNKDGRLFAVNANDSKLVWETRLDPGGILGGMQFGIASDGKTIITGNANSQNNNRDINKPFVDVLEFNRINFHENPINPIKRPLRVSMHHRFDGDKGIPRPAPGPFMPHKGPTLTGTNPPKEGETKSVTNRYPLYVNNMPVPGKTDAMLTGPLSGPFELWRLHNAPKDIVTDCINIFDVNINLKNPKPDLAKCQKGITASENKPLYTIAGMVSAVDAKTGKIKWQRPATDSIHGKQGISMTDGSPTIANDIVFFGYRDSHGTMVGLDMETGKKLFQYNAQVAIDSKGTMKNSGSFSAGPTIVDNVIYWGVGTGFGGSPSGYDQKKAEPTSYNNGGNRLYVFELPKEENKNDASEDKTD